MKKGLSKIGIVLVITIIITFSAILFVLMYFFIESKITANTEKIPENITEQNNPAKDLNYYLPEYFAAIKITRGMYNANVTGVLISFEDNSSNVYDYNSSIYPEIQEAKLYTIIKDDLSPKPPESWKFSNVKTVHLRYLIDGYNPSAIIQTTQINSEKSENFAENCIYSPEGRVVSCN